MFFVPKFLPNILIFTSKSCNRNFGSLSKRVYPWMDRQKAYWVDKSVVPETDVDLTDQNVAFIRNETELRLNEQLNELAKVEHFSKEWIPKVTQRVGLIGTKIGLYPLWTKEGEKLDCTIIQIPDNHALSYTPPEKVRDVLSLKEPRGFWLNNKEVPSWVNHQRWGLQLVGAVTANPSEYSSEWNAIFEKHGVPTKRKVGRFLVSPDAALMPGTALKMNHFRLGDYVDITARTINRGFQGGIEKHGMSGGPSAYGSTKFHRRIGSRAGGGMKIVRGKREAGLMGNRFRTSRGRLIVRMNPRLGLIYVLGPTPGPVHSFCYLNDSWLCNRRRELDDNPPPVPTWYPSAEDLESERKMLEQGFDDDFQFDLYHEMLHQPEHGTIHFK